MDITDNKILERITRMLDTAAGEADYKVKWARVNRAAGMLAVVCAEGGADTIVDAVIYGQVLLDKIAGMAVLGDTRETMVRGLGERLVRALQEWYGGTSV